LGHPNGKFCGIFRRYWHIKRAVMKKSAIKNSGDFPYWGIDGCKGGWLCVGLNCGGEFCAFVAKDIRCAHQKMKARKAKIALIDIPIGLSDGKEERKCDKSARKFIGKRYRSVFRVPCRQAIDAYKKCGKDAGKKKSCEITGGPLSEQTWAIASKIAEVDCFLQCLAQKNDKKFQLREVHPEVCFRALKGAELGYSKKKLCGREERRKILSKYLPDAKTIESEIKGCHRGKVADDDILDAMVAAVTAITGFSQYETLPSPPENSLKDSRGLPMEMVLSKGKTQNGN